MVFADTPLYQLLQPSGGLISGVGQLPIQPGEPRFAVMSAVLGDLKHALPGVALATRGVSSEASRLDGAGGSVDADEAQLKAAAEALERYSSCVYSDDQFIWATANELGADALDLDTLPRCSPTELAYPRCPIVAPDKNAPLRWVRGISLFDGRPVWIPAIMVYLHLPFVSRGERSWLPISTGCAIHTSYEQALTNALCEVIERDAISLTWLQMLELPRIEIDVVSEWLAPYLAASERAEYGIENLFFDATTDVGVPTVYSLHRSPNNPRLTAMVMCSTELDPSVAIGKVLRESASSRIALQLERTIPENWDDYLHVFHGATYMGRPEQYSAFDFLANSPARRRLSEMPVLHDKGDPKQALSLVLDRLKARNMPAYAVDLTPDEAVRVGMHAVRVIVPALQPLSFSYRARYLAHPRLYDAPRLMGYPVRTEADVNPWPQPFA